MLSAQTRGGDVAPVEPLLVGVCADPSRARRIGRALLRDGHEVPVLAAGLEAMVAGCAHVTPHVVVTAWPGDARDGAALLRAQAAALPQARAVVVLPAATPEATRARWRPAPTASWRRRAWS